MEELIDSPDRKKPKSLLVVYPMVLGVLLIAVSFLFKIMHWPLSSTLKVLGLSIVISYALLSFLYTEKTWLQQPLRILGGFAFFYIFFDSWGMMYGTVFYYTSFIICLIVAAIIQITFLESRKAIRIKKAKLANENP